MQRIFIIVLLISSLLHAQPRDEQLIKMLAGSCTDCHDEDLDRGGVRFDDSTALKDHHLMEKAFLQLRSGDMPPPDKSKISQEQRAEFLRLLAGPPQSSPAPPVKRLTRQEFLYSL